MYKTLLVIFFSILCVSSFQANAQWNEQKGRGQRANSDIEKEPQPVLRKSIHDYAKEYGYGTGGRGNSKGAGGKGGFDLNKVPRIKLSTQNYASNLHYSCSGHWKKSSCISSTAYLSRELMFDYQNKLKDAGKDDELYILKGMCEQPAKAVTQAINEVAHRKNIQKCVNTIQDLSAQSGVKPNADIFKLASWSVICMAQSPQCKQIEKNLEIIGKK